jgi:hypothetical protein
VGFYPLNFCEVNFGGRILPPQQIVDKIFTNYYHIKPTANVGISLLRRPNMPAGTAAPGGTVADIRRGLQPIINAMSRYISKNPKAFILGTDKEVPDSYAPKTGKEVEIIIFQ